MLFKQAMQVKKPTATINSCKSSISITKIRKGEASRDLFMPPMGKPWDCVWLPYTKTSFLSLHMFWFRSKHCMCWLGPLSTYATEWDILGHITNQTSIKCFHCKDQIWNQMYTKFSLSLSLWVQKQLSCLGIAEFELSPESCSPLKALHVACCAENKRTHFSLFTPLFLSLLHFSNTHIIKTACPIDAVSVKCTRRLLLPSTKDPALCTLWAVAELQQGCRPYI